MVKRALLVLVFWEARACPPAEETLDIVIIDSQKEVFVL
jgi:hypothetical protein